MDVALNTERTCGSYVPEGAPLSFQRNVSLPGSSWLRLKRVDRYGRFRLTDGEGALSCEVHLTKNFMDAFIGRNDNVVVPFSCEKKFLIKILIESWSVARIMPTLGGAGAVWVPLWYAFSLVHNDGAPGRSERFPNLLIAEDRHDQFQVVSVNWSPDFGHWGFDAFPVTNGARICMYARFYLPAQGATSR